MKTSDRRGQCGAAPGEGTSVVSGQEEPTEAQRMRADQGMAERATLPIDSMG